MALAHRAFIDAWLRVYPEDRAGARNLLKGLVPQLNEAGLGTICEIFDAEEPFTPRVYRASLECGGNAPVLGENRRVGHCVPLAEEELFSLLEKRLAQQRRGIVMKVWPGQPYPLGATWDGAGVNFALFSENASGRSVPVREARWRP